MPTRSLPAVFLICLLWPVPHASAHYLWVEIDAEADEHGMAVIYFEEAPAPGDGHYLDHFTSSGKIWFRSVEQIEPKRLKPMDIRNGGKRWLAASLPAGAPRSISMYGKFGVYRYGQTDVLLHYYARQLDVQTHEDLHELGRAEHMRLDILPHDSGSEVQLTVLWRGKPAAERMVYIRGPRKFRKNIRTDQYGHVLFSLDKAGKYTFRTSVEEATPGEENGYAYALVRHNATLIVCLPMGK